MVCSEVGVTVHSVTLGKDRYHQHIEMCDWCRDTLGSGKWVWHKPDNWAPLDDHRWCVCSTFGNTTFSFQHERDYVWFLMRWL